ncbi:unnamed protein product [Allacma fusca]|uniref:Uncharacterized protein n=1 Tax=Allacma fusca TaxID=39272 RepID=A0A8J2J1D2_9HEXA|nr:unnamed protein product [Allacma fusca]
MNSFNNLAYTVGGNAVQGCGVGRFGYTPTVNPPYATLRNTSAVGQSSNWTQPQPQSAVQPLSSWNGWQYSPSQNVPQTQSSSEGIAMGAQTNQGNHANWRNMTGLSPMNFQQPVTTTGTSPFQHKPYSSPASLKQSPQPPSQSVAECMNVPYLTANKDQYNQQVPTPLQPTDANPFQQYFQNNQSAQRDPSLGCHVKIGAQGDQPVVYTKGDNDEQQFQGKTSVNDQQGIANRIGHQGSQNPNYQQGLTQQQQPTPCQYSNTAPLPSANHIAKNERKGFTPCGNCPACKYQNKGITTRPGQPRLVRGPRTQKQKTIDAPATDQSQQQGDNAVLNKSSALLAPGLVHLPMPSTS